MRALGFHEHGDVKNLQIVDLPTPKPGPGEVRVRVHFAALNRLDLFVLKGWKGLELAKPHVGGSDIAGVVDALGEGVTNWAQGDRVVVYPDLSCGTCAACRRGDIPLCLKHRLLGEHERGGFAQSICVSAASLKRVPESVPLEHAAAASLVFLTAWRMVITRGRLRAGESCLIVGAAGGVNSAAIQIAKLAGAHPIFVVGTSQAKLEVARGLGADHLLDANGAWEKEAFRISEKRGVDLVIDNVGEKTWTKSLRTAARGGRIVTVGGTTGYNPSAELNQVFWKGLDILGSTMGTRDEYDTVMDLVFAGRLSAVIDTVHKLEAGAEAYTRLASGDATGKVLLDLR